MVKLKRQLIIISASCADPVFVGIDCVSATILILVVTCWGPTDFQDIIRQAQDNVDVVTETDQSLALRELKENMVILGMWIILGLCGGYSFIKVEALLKLWGCRGNVDSRMVILKLTARTFFLLLYILAVIQQMVAATGDGDFGIILAALTGNIWGVGVPLMFVIAPDCDFPPAESKHFDPSATTV